MKQKTTNRFARIQQNAVKSGYARPTASPKDTPNGGIALTPAECAHLLPLMRRAEIAQRVLKSAMQPVNLAITLIAGRAGAAPGLTYRLDAQTRTLVPVATVPEGK